MYFLVDFFHFFITLQLMDYMKRVLTCVMRILKVVKVETDNISTFLPLTVPSCIVVTAAVSKTIRSLSIFLRA